MLQSNTAAIVLTLFIGFLGGAVGLFYWYQSSYIAKHRAHKLKPEQEDKDIDIDKIRALRVKKFQYFKLPPLPWGKLQQQTHISQVQGDLKLNELRNRGQNSPISSLEELHDWQPSIDEWERLKMSTVKFTNFKEDDRPQILVCHDYDGGYKSDQYLFGNDQFNAYKVYRWQCIDIFVYFSHKLVAIPPTGWIHAAHKNGVKILGTFITEWEKGAEICKEFLKDEQTANLYAEKLADLALFYGFEGWLINIENKIEQSQISTLVYFIKKLREHVHIRIKGGLVIWYDSVIQDGTLDWQNTINDKNKLFFDVSDAIFVNYQWKPNDLKKLVDNSKTRKKYVFMGIDVFARNTFYKAGLDSCKGVEVVLQNSLSVAIFAPGWTHQVGPESKNQDWMINDDEFWTSVGDCVCKSSDPKVNLERKFEIDHLPFSSDFNTGSGKSYFINGELACTQNWFNLSLQQTQPITHLKTCQETVFNGSTSIILTDELTPLFNFDIELDHGLEIGFAIFGGQANLILNLVDSSAKLDSPIRNRQITLQSGETEQINRSFSRSKSQSRQTNNLIIQPIGKKTIPVDSGEWITYRFHVPTFRTKGWKLDQISCENADTSELGKIYRLGKIWCKIIEESPISYEISNLNISQVVFKIDSTTLKGILFGTLRWKIEGDQHIDRFDVWYGIDDEEVCIDKYKVQEGSKVPKGMSFLGQTWMRLFQVNDLEVGANGCRVWFVVQGVDQLGQRQRVSEASVVELALR